MSIKNKKKSQLQRIQAYGQDILQNDTYRSMKQYAQHGDVSVLEHCMRVAQTSLAFSDFLRRFNINANERELVRGALLHDYFLYDWHIRDKDKNEKFFEKHGFTHAATALRNASKDFDLTPKEKDIIAKHMFPLNVSKVPSCLESWIVTLSDKYCSLIETLAMRHRVQGQVGKA